MHVSIVYAEMLICMLKAQISILLHSATHTKYHWTTVVEETKSSDESVMQVLLQNYILPDSLKIEFIFLHIHDAIE